MFCAFNIKYLSGKLNEGKAIATPRTIISTLVFYLRCMSDQHFSREIPTQSKFTWKLKMKSSRYEKVFSSDNEDAPDIENRSEKKWNPFRRCSRSSLDFRLLLKDEQWYQAVKTDDFSTIFFLRLHFYSDQKIIFYYIIYSSSKSFRS